MRRLFSRRGREARKQEGKGKDSDHDFIPAGATCEFVKPISCSDLKLVTLIHLAGAATFADWPLRLSASATKPDAFISSTKPRKYFAPSIRPFGVPIAC